MPRDTDDQAPVTPWPAPALWLVEQAEACGVPLFIARNEARLDQLAGAAPVFAGERVEVLVLPPWDVLPYDRIPPSAGVVGRRVLALSVLARPGTRPRLVLTCADATLQRVRPPGAWKNAELALSQGEALHFDALCAALAERGYQHLDDRVDEPGEVAIRGRAIDEFPAGQPRPVRLSVEPADGSDGRIAALHAFDPATQRSAEEIDRVVLHPAVEFPLDPEEVEDAAEALAHPDSPDLAVENASLPLPPAAPSHAVVRLPARRRRDLGRHGGGALERFPRADRGRLCRHQQSPSRRARRHSAAAEPALPDARTSMGRSRRPAPARGRAGHAGEAAAPG